MTTAVPRAGTGSSRTRAPEFRVKNATTPAESASANWALARALWSDRNQRQRALLLAEEARLGFIESRKLHGTTWDKNLHEVEAWQAERNKPVR